MDGNHHRNNSTHLQNTADNSYNNKENVLSENSLQFQDLIGNATSDLNGIGMISQNLMYEGEQPITKKDTQKRIV